MNPQQRMYYQRQDNDRQRLPYDVHFQRGGKRSHYNEQRGGGRGGWQQPRGMEDRQMGRPFKRQRGMGSAGGGGDRGGRFVRGRGDRGGSRGNYRRQRNYRRQDQLPLGRTPIHAPNAPEYHPTPQPDPQARTGLSKEQEEVRDREIAELEAMVNAGSSVGDDGGMNQISCNGPSNIRQFIRVHRMPQDMEEIQDVDFIEIDQEQYALENDPDLDPRIRETLRSLRNCIADLEEENWELRDRLRDLDPQYAALQDQEGTVQEHSEMDVEPQLHQVMHENLYGSQNEVVGNVYHQDQEHEEVVGQSPQQQQQVDQVQLQQQQPQQQQHQLLPLQLEHGNEQQLDLSVDNSNAASELNEYQDQSVQEEETAGNEQVLQHQLGQIQEA